MSDVASSVGRAAAGALVAFRSVVGDDAELVRCLARVMAEPFPSAEQADRALVELVRGADVVRWARPDLFPESLR